MKLLYDNNNNKEEIKKTQSIEQYLTENDFKNLNFQIIGIEWNSFIDYDGHIAIVLFTDNCNFNCKYCHNKRMLLTNYNNLNLHNLLDSLMQRRKFNDAVVICGGEPTLQKSLPLVVKILKKLGYKVKLDTNGANIDMLQLVIDDIDYIALDIKTTPDKYYLLGANQTAMQNTFATLRWLQKLKSNTNITYKFDFEIRTTVFPEIVNLDDLKKLKSLINPAKYKWFLQTFKLSQDVMIFTDDFNVIKAQQIQSEKIITDFLNKKITINFPIRLLVDELK